MTAGCFIFILCCCHGGDRDRKPPPSSPAPAAPQPRLWGLDLSLSWDPRSPGEVSSTGSRSWGCGLCSQPPPHSCRIPVLVCSPPPPSAPHRAGLPCPSAKWSRLWGGLDCRLCLVPQSGARCSLELACAAPQSLRGVFLIRSCDLNLWVKLGLAGRSRTGLPGVCLPSGPWHLPGRPQPCGAGGEPACPDHPPGEGAGKPPPAFLAHLGPSAPQARVSEAPALALPCRVLSHTGQAGLRAVAMLVPGSALQVPGWLQRACYPCAPGKLSGKGEARVPGCQGHPGVGHVSGRQL